MKCVLVFSLLVSSCNLFAGTVLPPIYSQDKYLDIHTHVACIDGVDDGCYTSPSLKGSYKYDVYLKAFGVDQPQVMKYGGALIFERLNQKIRNSELVKASIVLALDGVITNNELDKNETQLYIPNEFILKNISQYDNMLFGASINPYRSNAIDLLEEAKDNGAVLIKWIPSTMYIDPSDEKIIPFYKKMIELNLPLLTHAGKERSFRWARDSFSDPEKLKLPLDLGVTVIAAHVASSGRGDFKKLLGLFRNPAYRHNLFADISAITQFNRILRVKNILNDKTFNGRLLYGTDWPLIDVQMPILKIKLTPFYLYPLFTPLKWRQVAELNQIKNSFDQDITLKKLLGFRDEDFRQSERLFLPFSTVK